MERAKRLFKAWRQGESDHGAPPLPDEGTPFLPPDDEALVDVVYSQSGALRVGISKDAAGVHRLRAERWAADGTSPAKPPGRRASSSRAPARVAARARTLAAEWLEDRGEAPRDEHGGMTARP